MKRIILPLFILLTLGGIPFYFYTQNGVNNKTQFSTSLVRTDNELVQRVDLIKENTHTSGVGVILRKKENNAQRQVIVDVELTAQEYTAFDAVDLKLIFENNSVAPQCTTGNATPLYPRFAVTEKELELTGTANITNKHILFGNSNALLVSCTFEKGQTVQQLAVSLDVDNTHIYSLGNDIIDIANSITQVTIKL